MKKHIEKEYGCVEAPELKAIAEDEALQKRVDRLMEIRHIEDDFYHVMLSSSLEHVLTFVLYMSLICLGACLAFYFVKNYQEGEDDNG